MKKQYFTILPAIVLILFFATGAFASSGGYQSLHLSTTSISLSVGQTRTVYIDDNYNNSYRGYYLAGNLSSGVVIATLNGSALDIYGQLPGTVTVTVCSSYRYGGDCADVRVRVSGSSYYNYNNNYPNYYGNQISLSSTNAVLTVGSSVAITVYGNYGYGNYYGYGFTATSGNPSVATTSLYGNILTVYGVNPGNTWINVCGMGSCNSLSVTVTGSPYYNQAPYYYPSMYPYMMPYNQNMYWSGQSWQYR